MLSVFKNIPLLNVAFNILASITLRLSSLIVTTLIVKYVGQSEFGHYIYIITTALMLSSFSTMSTGQAFIRNISINSDKKNDFFIYLSNVLCIFVLFSGLFFSFSYFVSYNEYIINNWQVIMVIALLELVNMAYISYFSGKEAFSKIFNARLIFAITLAAIIFISVKFDHYIFVYPYIIALIIANLYLLKAVNIKFSFNNFHFFNKKKLHNFYFKYIKLSFPIFLSGLMVTPVQWFLSNQIVLQNNFAELGLFNISMQFRMMILMVTSSIATALLPRLVRTSQTETFQQIKKSGYLISAVFCMVMLLVIGLFMPIIFNFYNIETNLKILQTSYLLLATALPLSIYNLYTQTLIAKAKTSSLLLFNSFWGVLVIFMYLLTEKIDNLSVAKILCLSYFLLIFFVFLFNKVKREN